MSTHTTSDSHHAPTTPSGRRRPRVIGLVAVGLAVLVALGWWLTRSAAPRPQEPSTSSPPTDEVTLDADGQREAGITVAAVATALQAETLQANAVVALNEQRTARVGSMVEGTVVATFRDVGDRVRAGEVLAHMHSHVVHDAWADYRKAIAERRRAQTDAAFARDAEQRAVRLLDDKAISSQDLQRARAALAAAEEQVDIAGTEVRRAEEALEHLGITNSEDPTGESGEQIPARAPIAGVVLERLVTAGTAVTPGTSLFVISDLGSLWVMAEVDESLLARVAKDRPVEARVPAYPDEAFPGRVTFVGDTVNPKTRRIVVRCEVPNPTGHLKPEMYATVRIETGQPREVPVVPAAAVQELRNRTVVFVEDVTGRFQARDVEVGPEQRGLVEVRRGVRKGERVVTAGAFLLKSSLLSGDAPEGD